MHPKLAFHQISKELESASKNPTKREELINHKLTIVIFVLFQIDEIAAICDHRIDAAK